MSTGVDTRRRSLGRWVAGKVRNGVFIQHWDGLHLRCNLCGGDVITLKAGQRMVDVARAWVLHQGPCEKKNFPNT